MTSLKIELGERSYNVTIGSGTLLKLDKYMNLKRKVFILTDNKVHKEYSEAVKSQSKDAVIYTVKSGEISKSIETFGEVLTAMLDFGMTRSDCVVAVGGGVVGDLAGFAASAYMRGIDFYNIPTTLLSQVDSSIGGKTAINLGSVKNVVGAFYQPSAVVIDTEVLKTLDKRQLASGLSEALKMSITSDKELFSIFETEEIGEDNMEKIIVRSLLIKKAVVENDEKESGLRKILNFGHTFGHGIEAGCNGKLYHGECVALGMIPMCSESLRKRLIKILNKLGLPTEYNYDTEAALSLVAHDKKCSGGEIDVIFADEVGEGYIKKLTIDDFCNTIRTRLKN